MRQRAFGLILLASASILPIVTRPALADPAPVPVAELIKPINIPYQQFTLANGLRVLVHSDHKAPIVAVNIWYHIGSKDEPAGKTGFAHLFEHLMFNGSEHAPGSVIEQMEQLGASEVNGTTNNDRTNFFETVPTGALDRALFIESDRMGYLLQGLPQAKLNVQRGVVQNEKRRGDNEPGGLLQYTLVENLFPAGHPYHHTVIGSMADLDQASMGDVRNWFRANYGPNNAVLVLSGDIDLATAKAKVEHWFGDLPRGPQVVHPVVEVPKLAVPKTIELHDQVGLTTIFRAWPVPGGSNADVAPLDLAASVLGGLDSSRFSNVLVRRDQVSVGAGAANRSFENGGYFLVDAAVKPGVSVADATKALDDVIATFLRDGPTRSELDRATVSAVTSTLGTLERDNGAAETLASGLTYANDPEEYQHELARYAQATPALVRDIARKWLGRPALTIILSPGTRTAYQEAGPRAIAGDTPALLASIVSPDRTVPPPLQPLSTLTFPKIERTTLSNGIPLFFVRRADVPVVQLTLSFDAGDAADNAAKLGAQYLMLAMLSEGTAKRSSSQIAVDSEALGARITQSVTSDRSTIGLYALKPNLAASLDLLADVTLHPAFAPLEVKRVRDQQLAQIDEQNKDPNTIGQRALSLALYGAQHPYGRIGQNLGTTQTVSSVTPSDLEKAYHDWLRPDTLRIFAAGDSDIATLRAQLDERFGHWALPITAKPIKDFSMAPPAPQPRIIMIDRPDSPQSIILAGHLLNATGRDDLLTVRVANEVLGGGFASRIYHDLREVKSWAYGTSATISSKLNQVDFTIGAPVQADKTGPTISAILSDTRDFLTAHGVTDTEYHRVIDSDTRALPGEFETTGAVLGGVERIIMYGRPDDYYTQLPMRFHALTPSAIDSAARANFDAGKLVFVVVGDAKQVVPQLAGLGLPIVTPKP